MKTIYTILLGSALITAAIPAAPADVLEHERFDCLIEPMMRIELGSPTQGVVKSIEVERSDNVEPGQVLAELESSVEQAALSQASARARMTGELQAAEADLKLAEQHLTRVEGLFAKAMVSSQQRDEARAQHEVARMRVQQAWERRKIAEHDAAYARTVVQKRKIRSPIAGVVVERKAFPGEFVYENPIMTLAQLDPLRVEVILPASYYGTLRPGMRAEVFAEVSDKAAYVATVRRVDRVIDAGSSTFGAQLELANPDLAIPAGQRCELVFTDPLPAERVASRD